MKSRKNASSQGAILSHRHFKYMLALGLAMAIAGCKKDKEAPAVIEEVPAAATAPETDTSATLSEEPSLQQVGKEKPGAKNTFHPSGAKASPAAEAAGFSDAGHFVVQVAIFKSKRQASNLVEKLANSGYPAYVAEVENPVPQLAGTYHRVRIGKFMRIADARSFGENTLKPMGYDFWVDNKKNDAVGGDGSAYSAPAPAAEPEPAAAPVSRRSKKAVEPAEPAAPSGETWGTPKEPATPSGETWGTPKTEEPATPTRESGTLQSEQPTASSPTKASSAPSAPASAPAKTGADTGKVNLDEW
jgi:hypothetical protein